MKKQKKELWLSVIALGFRARSTGVRTGVVGTLCSSEGLQEVLDGHDARCLG